MWFVGEVLGIVISRNQRFSDNTLRFHLNAWEYIQQAKIVLNKMQEQASLSQPVRKKDSV